MSIAYRTPDYGLLCEECAKHMALWGWLRLYTIDPDEYLESSPVVSPRIGDRCQRCGKELWKENAKLTLW